MKSMIRWLVLSVGVAAFCLVADAIADVQNILVVHPTSLVTRGDPARQRVEITAVCDAPVEKGVVKIWSGDKLFHQHEVGALTQGTNSLSILLPEPKKTHSTRWKLFSGTKVVSETKLTWTPPRHWQLYVIKSSHIDIGLHDSQYVQRYLANSCVDKAEDLAEKHTDWPEASRFRYVVEGLWWWQNYVQDRPVEQIDRIVERYCKSGLFGIAASHSGNRTEMYSSEELCRSTYCIQQARDRWNLPMDTMLMVDNNGLTWPLVTAYADAGVKYAGFFVNAWNPGAKKSALGWGKDSSRDYVGAGGERGGSLIEVGWDTEMPHLFYWLGPDKKSRLLVWTSPTYTSGGHDFGLGDSNKKVAEKKMLQHLSKLENKYPYDIWLLPFYHDNESPGLSMPSFAKDWNARWRWPEIRTVGDLSVPFRQVEKRFGDKIPVLSGMITAGWAQHPASTPSLLAAKREADRLLPVAEKLATLARLTDPGFIYPALELRRAWDCLICNDEHGYGVSSYKGRKVFDTWMQKRDWLAKAQETAEQQCSRAMQSMAAQVSGKGVLVFNPTLQSRSDCVEIEPSEAFKGHSLVRSPDGRIFPGVVQDGKFRFLASDVPPMGYLRFELLKGDVAPVKTKDASEPPMIENRYYRLQFKVDGSISSLYDKQLKRELIDPDASYRCNQFLYSSDFNKSFSSPEKACFKVEKSTLETKVTATMDDVVTGAEIVQCVTLPNHEKRIDIDNRLNHVKDLAHKSRYNSFGYYAFPFEVPQGRFRIGLNGCSADAYKDQSGLSTDTYHAARDWSYVGNGEFGVSLVQLDSMLVECGKIHKMKNVIEGEPVSSHLYSYIFNDWLFSHAYETGPSHINLRYRYVISSHAGAFSDSGVEQLAERICAPLLAKEILGNGKGALPSDSHSFLSTDAPGVKLLALKMSEAPGGGLIARFHETGGNQVDAMKVKLGMGDDLCLISCSVTEDNRALMKSASLSMSSYGYATMRIEKRGESPAAPDVKHKVTEQSVFLNWEPVKQTTQYNVYRGEKRGFKADACHLIATVGGTSFTDNGLKSASTYCYRVCAEDAAARQGGSVEVSVKTLAEGSQPPAKVGLHYTGLISGLRAWRGVEKDLLYLQWGQNMESDLSHYELYRGETPGFKVSEKYFVAKVEPGPYVIVPYEDRGLKPHTAYYYRVIAVDRDGNKSEPSDLCVGTTREM